MTATLYVNASRCTLLSLLARPDARARPCPPLLCARGSPPQSPPLASGQLTAASSFVCSARFMSCSAPMSAYLSTTIPTKATTNTFASFSSRSPLLLPPVFCAPRSSSGDGACVSLIMNRRIRHPTTPTRSGDSEEQTERQREREICDTALHTRKYIYIYVERESDRDDESHKHTRR